MTSLIPNAEYMDLQESIETQRGENRILKQKLQSKAEALLILSKELDRYNSMCPIFKKKLH